jgi:putative glutamine amidotransferase
VARIGITSGRTPEGAATLKGAYVEAVRAAGGLPLVLPVLGPGDVDAALDAVDGLLLTGGGDVDPACYGAATAPEVGGVDRGRDDWELHLPRTAAAAGVPVLAVCRGMQVVNVAAGGSLVQHLPAVTPLSHADRERSRREVHPVTVAAGSALAGITGAGRLDVNTLHHQAVDRLGAGLRVTALAPDGVVEGIEANAGHLVGVQWHPELLADRPPHLALFRWLVAAATTTPRRPPRPSEPSWTAASPS